MMGTIELPPAAEPPAPATVPEDGADVGEREDTVGAEVCAGLGDVGADVNERDDGVGEGVGKKVDPAAVGVPLAPAVIGADDVIRSVGGVVGGGFVGVLVG